MNTAALRALIEQARQEEVRTGHLERLLDAQLARLHPAIRLSSQDSRAVLQAFVNTYIERVPEMLEAAANVAREAGLEEPLGPVLRQAEQFFLQPPELTRNHQGLGGLLDEAYLTHRLVEEVNDRYIAHLGQPLIPLDTTVANLIAHQLIGEDFANQLDETVHQAVAELLDEDSFDGPALQAWRNRLQSPQTAAAWQRWPCLSRQLGVELELPQQRQNH